MGSKGDTNRQNRLEVADIFREYGSNYRKIYHTPVEYTKVMNLITCCRTAAMGGHIEKCGECGYEKNAYNSCRNRHCPKCQYAAREKWIIQRQRELLPVAYYHIVFTVPDLLNRLTLVNKRIVYNILFKASSETLLKLGKDPKHLGANIGLLAILHTWGENLMDHPHIHCIVPGGGLSENSDEWRYPQKARFKGFFIHVNVISDLFKKKFLYYLKKAYKNNELKFVGEIEELASQRAFQKLLNELYSKKWVTYCKRPFGGPKQILGYLSRYTHRVAISNHRIKRMESGKVIFESKKYKDNNKKIEISLMPVEFIRRFLLHILPGGFFKIRYYGILSSRNKKFVLQKCRELLNHDADKTDENIEQELPEYKIWKCPVCKKGRMFVPNKFSVKAAPT